MCGPQLALGLGLAALGLGALKSTTTKAVETPTINTYTAPDPPAPSMRPDAPVASPVMTTQGQEQAEDEQKATENMVRKNKKGRNMLRIDRTVPNSSGLGGGSGVNVPAG